MIGSGPSQLALAVGQANAQQTYSDNIVAQGGHLALASVVDFGTAVYNSLDFFDVLEDAETTSVLDGLGAESTADFYQDNKDLVNAVSFIGGVFVPGGLAVKGSQLLRAGLKGSHFLNPQSTRGKLRTASRMIREGKRSTEEYTALKISTLRNAVAQGIVDNGAAELAILTTLNAHPLMEEYMEDLPSNFLTSMAFGSAISGVIDLASTSNRIATVAGNTLARAHRPVLDALPQKPLVTSEGTDFKVLDQTIRELDGIITNESYSIETRAFAKSARLTTEVEARKATEAVVAPTGIAKDDTAFLEQVEDVLRRPESFGVERFRFFNAKPTDKPTALNRLTSLFRTTDEGEQTARGVYSPQFGFYVDEGSAARIASAVDSGETVDTVRRAADKAFRSGSWRVAKEEGDNLVGATAAEVDTDYLVKLATFDRLSITQLGQASVHNSDIASIQAIAARVRKEEVAIERLRTNADELREQATAQGKTPKQVDDLNKQADQVEARANTQQTKLDGLRVNIAGSAPTEQALRSQRIGKDHVAKVRRATEGLPSMVDSVSPALGNVLRRWVAGEPGVDTALRTEVATLLRTGQSDNQAVRELLSSEHANSVRASLSKVADNQGRIHLTPNPLRSAGQGFEVETYSLATQANAKVKPISVQSVIGMIRNADGSNHILAVDTTRNAVRSNLGNLRLDGDGAIITNDAAITGADASAFAERATTDWVIQQSRAALDDGFGIEELARRANLDVPSVQRILGMPDGDALAAGGGVGQRYSDAAELGEYLSNRQRLLVGEDSGNLDSYYDYVKMLEAGTDRKVLDEWATSTTLDLMTTSQSRLVTQLMRNYGADSAKGQANFRTQLQLLKRSLGLVNDELGRTRLIQSADSYSNRMGDAGRIINHFGDKFTAAYNETLNNYVSPMNATLSRIAQNDAQLVTLNTAIQVHRSIGEGTIRFADGVFLNRASPRDQWKEVMWEGKVFKVPDSMPDVRQFLEQSGRVGQELHQMRITKSKLTGGIAPQNKGFWIPNFDARSKNIMFMRLSNGDQRIITGNTVQELETKRQALQDFHNGNVEFITPKQREDFNYLKGLADDGQLSAADIGKTRAGKLANALPAATLEDARGVINSLADQLFSGAKNLHGIVFDDSLQLLRQQESFAKEAIENQGESKLRRVIGDPVHAASIQRETLLGSRQQLSQFTTWNNVNSAFESILTSTLNKWNRISEGFEVRSGRASDRLASLKDELEEAGVPYPYQAFEDAKAVELFHREAKPADARRVISAGNGLAATMALRFMELAQPIVNAMSLPIMSYSAAAQKYDRQFLGYTQQRAAEYPLRYMMNGVRAMHDDTYNGLFKQAEDQGFFSPVVSEATEAIKLTRLREQGLLSKAENALDRIDGLLGGKTVAASDYSESLVRKVSFSTGVQLGKELYGMKEGVDDAALLIFAKNYMDRSIGNYSASQRPVLFHGTAGAAIGLFQTYMVTFAQNMYRHIEQRDFKAIAGVMLTQAGIFGTGSLPGYDMVSKYIGENYSDNHTDLTTGLYRAVNDQTASAILYGLPSNLGGLAGLPGGGPNFSSRGAIDPRFPILNGDPPAAASVVVESAKALGNIAQRIATSGASETPTAVLEAVSMQSVSRPIARVAELLTGDSVTRAGHTVQTPEEVYTPMGVLSRILAVRPTDEVRLREATHLNTYYGAKDRENRQNAMLRIRTAIREEALDQGLVEQVALEYFNNGGTGQGFRSALNQAMQAESTSLQVTLRRELKPDSPLINMLMDI